MTLCRSVLDGGQVPLPLSGAMDETQALSVRLVGRRALLSTTANANECMPAKTVPETTASR
jgi:hypothetical protein